MAGNIKTTLQFFLQRRTGTGAWSTIDTSDTLLVTSTDVGQNFTTAGKISVTFNAATLNWTNNAQYRMLVRKKIVDNASVGFSLSTAHGNIEGVSTA